MLLYYLSFNRKSAFADVFPRYICNVNIDKIPYKTDAHHGKA